MTENARAYILVLAPTRWKLRKAVAAVNRGLGALGLEKHPDKTCIGRTEKGFDSLGHRFDRAGLSVGAKSIEQFIERARRRRAPAGATCLRAYVRRGVGWAMGGSQGRERPGIPPIVDLLRE